MFAILAGTNIDGAFFSVKTLIGALQILKVYISSSI
jgi:hypothetical protein